MPYEECSRPRELTYKRSCLSSPAENEPVSGASGNPKLMISVSALATPKQLIASNVTTHSGMRISAMIPCVGGISLYRMALLSSMIDKIRQSFMTSASVKAT